MNNLLAVLELKAYATTAVGVEAISGINVTSVTQLVTVIANVLIVVGISITVIMFIVSAIRGGAKALAYVVIGMIGLLVVYGLKTILLNLIAGSDISETY